MCACIFLQKCILFITCHNCFKWFHQYSKTSTEKFFLPKLICVDHLLLQNKLLLLFSHSVMSSSLWPHGLQHARLPSPSLSPGVCSNSCPLNQQYHPTISSSAALFLPSIFPSMRVFSNESALRIRWPKYWSFSISPSNEYSELISFRIDRTNYIHLNHMLHLGVFLCVYG